MATKQWTQLGMRMNWWCSRMRKHCHSSSFTSNKSKDVLLLDNEEEEEEPSFFLFFFHFLLHMFVILADLFHRGQNESLHKQSPQLRRAQWSQLVFLPFLSKIVKLHLVCRISACQSGAGGSLVALRFLPKMQRTPTTKRRINKERMKKGIKDTRTLFCFVKTRDPRA